MNDYLQNLWNMKKSILHIFKTLDVILAVNREKNGNPNAYLVGFFKGQSAWKIRCQRAWLPLKIWQLALLAGLFLSMDATAQQGNIECGLVLGSGSENLISFKVDNGEMYGMGIANNANFPTTDGSKPNTIDVFIMKTDAHCNLVFSKVIDGYGGAGQDYQMKVGQNFIFLIGTTTQNVAVTTNGSVRSGTQDFLLYIFDKATGNMVYGSYLGGAGIEKKIADIAVENDNLYILSGVRSTDFPITNGSVKTNPSTASDFALTKINGAGQIQYSTFLGPAVESPMLGRLVVENGEAYAITAIDRTVASWPVTDGSTPPSVGSYTIATKVDAAGNVVYSNNVFNQDYYLWGLNSYFLLEVENGNMYIAQADNNALIPSTNGTSGLGNNKTVLLTLDGSGTTSNLTYWDFPLSEMEVENGFIYVMSTSTTNATLPTTDGSTYRGGGDFYMMKLNPDHTPVYKEYLGGTDSDEPNQIDQDNILKIQNGEVFFLVYTQSMNFPVTDGLPIHYYSTVLGKLDTAGKLRFATFIPAAGAVGVWPMLDISGDLAYINAGQLINSAPNPYTYVNSNSSLGKIALSVIDMCPEFPTVTSDNLTPATQSVCKNAMVDVIIGPKITIPSDSLPLIYVAGLPRLQPAIEANYQWQSAPSASGPWTDILGAVQYLYTPQPMVETRYFRRIAYNLPSCGGDTLSISSVSAVIVGVNTAPVVDAGGVFNTCPGYPVTLNATVTGGTIPYSYDWDMGAADIEDPTVSPTVATVYTLIVTDNNGCRQIDQAIVNTYAADAGSPSVSVCNGAPQLIGGTPVAGLAGVSYSWTPTTGLSCTTCANPFATPLTTTKYYLSLTIPVTSGGTCTTKDSITVNAILPPTNNGGLFGGPDVVICKGQTALLGTSAESGFTYTWAPGNYLPDNLISRPRFTPGSLELPSSDPFRYYVTALKGGCVFVDSVLAYVIEARAGQDGCGPRLIGAGDRTPNINETYQWVKLSGTSEFTGPTDQAATTVSASTGGASVFELTTTFNGVMCKDTVLVDICGCSIGITVSAPFNCASYAVNNGDVTLSVVGALPATIAGGSFVYEWSVLSGPPGGLDSFFGPIVHLTDTIERTFQVVVSSTLAESLTCSATISVNGPAWSLPVFSAPDAFSCPNQGVVIGAPLVAGYSYSWNNPTLLNFSNISMPTATLTASTEFKVTVVDTGSGCAITDTLNVTVPNMVANAGPDHLICDNGTVVIGGIISYPPGYTVAWSPSNANWQNGTNSTSAQPEVLVAINQLFTLTVTSPTGCISTDNVLVKVGTPVAPFTLPNVSYCPGAGAVALGASVPTGFTYLWSPASLVTATTTRTTSTTATPPALQTTFYVSVKNASGCEFVGSQTIVPSEDPPIAGADAAICLGESVELGSALNPTGAGISYAWTGTGVSATYLSSTTSPTPTFTPTVAGSYTLTLAKTENGCVTRNTVRIYVNSFSLPTIPSSTVCAGSSLQIGTTPLLGVQYFWSPTTNLSNPSIANPVVSNIQATTTYTLLAIGSNGCAATADVVVGVNPEQAPTLAISPLVACLGESSKTVDATATPTGSYLYQWSPNNGSISSIYAEDPTISIFGLGTQQYTVTVTNTNSGCSSVAQTSLSVAYCAPPCALEILAATPTNCFENLYDLVVAVAYTNPPTGNIEIQINGSPYTFTPTGVSPEYFTINNLIPTGQTGIDVSAAFVDDLACSDILLDAYNAPAPCCPVSYSVNILQRTATINMGYTSASFNYMVVNGPTTSFYHDGTGSLSLAQLPNGSGTFEYFRGPGEQGVEVNIYAIIEDPDGSGPCVAARDTLTITILPSCTGLIDVQCVRPTSGTSNDGSVTLDFSNFPGTTYKTILYTNLCSPATFLFANSSPNNTFTISNLDDCVYMFYTTVSNSLFEPICVSTDLSIDFQYATLGFNSPICVGDTLQLTAVTSIADTTATYLWSGPNGFSSTEQNPVLAGYSVANEGLYTVTVTPSCGAPYTLDITVNSSAVTPTVSVSPCYDSNGNTAGGASLATVSVAVSWSSIPNDTIIVALGAESQLISTASNTSPVIVTFTVPADGAVHTDAIAISLMGLTNCDTTASYTAPMGDCLLHPCTTGSTGGVVWIDADGDGIQDATETGGLAGVTVTAYGDNGIVVATTITDALGQYNFGTLLTFPDTYRIEFTNIPAPYVKTFNGLDGRTDVQFISAAECDVDFAVMDPSAVNNCNTTNIILSCYSTTSTQPAVAFFPSTNSGETPGPTETTDIATVGALWGAANQAAQKRLFFSAVLKRHVALGPLGLGGVYVFDYSSGTATLSSSIDITTLPVANAGSAVSGPGNIDVGSVIRSGSSDYTIPASGPSVDLDAFGKVGKVGIGDVDMYNNTLWLINMNSAQRSLISIDMSGPTPGNTNRYLIDQLLGGAAPSCAGVLRPWGLGFGNGVGYLGLECDGTSGNASDLHSYIYSFNPANPAAGLTLVADFGMTYVREEAGANGNAEWKPWIDTWINTFNGQNELYPMPIVSDIEIDNAGGMSIALLDRHSFQMGYLNYPAVAGYPTTPYPNPNYDPNCATNCTPQPECAMYCAPEFLTGAYVQGISGGDVIKYCAGIAPGTFVQEGTGSCTVNDLGQVATNIDDGSKGSLPNLASGILTLDGVSQTGEFYWGDYFLNPGQTNGHEETALGSLLYDPYQNEIIATVFDPTDHYFQNGTHWYNPTTGQRTDNYLVVGNVNDGFGKGTSLGDMELYCVPQPAPLQIGNYVWIDADGDGTQDPSELPLGGVFVSLYKDIAGTFTLVAYTTTGTNGEYYFTGIGAPNENWISTSGTDSILPNMDYKIVFGYDGTNSQWMSGQLTISGVNYQLTIPNSGEGIAPDQNDSDASAMAIAGGNYPSIALTTGNAGETNHTFDAGFWVCNTPTQTCEITYGPIRVSGSLTDITTPDAAGRTYKSFQYYALPGSYYGPGGSIANTNSGGLYGTSSATLYHSGIYGNRMSCHFTVPEGNYTVLLHYCENAGEPAGGRVFDVFLNDQKVEDNFDIYVAAGGPNIALVKSYTVNVTGNNLTVRLAGEINAAYISGIEIIPNFCTAVQSVSISNVDVSGCYFNALGESKTTVSVEVAWDNLVTEDSIVVQFEGMTKVIYPGAYINATTYGTILSPQIVAFEINADGTSGHLATATINENTLCSDTSALFSLPANCPPTVCSGDQTGGTVFNDYNSDGVLDSGETTGLQGITVEAYDCDGNLVATTTTDLFGKYVFSGLTANNYPIRVEFTNIPSIYGQGTVVGSDGQTTVQFVQTANCEVDLGLLNPNDYCQNDPKLVIPCYVYGDPIPGSPAGTEAGAVSFDYNLAGLSNPPFMAHSVNAETGTLWGMAYNKFTGKLFSAATVKRHAGLGPLGIGGIYVSDFSNPSTGGTFSYAPFIDVATLGINVGSISSNAARGLTSTLSPQTIDLEGYLAAGKIGIGAIDLSEDGNALYLTNLYDNKLYKIDITSYNTTGTLPTASDVTAFDMGSTLSCTGGNLHVWAVKIHKGSIYTGFICDAGTSMDKSDLRAFVQKYDISAGGLPTTVIDIPLTYPKGIPWNGEPGASGWNPWTDNWDLKKAGPVLDTDGMITEVIVRPEPILASVELDIDGAMILAFGDRTGMQSGYRNLNPNGNDGLRYNGIVGGDILRAFSNGAAYVLENNAKVGSIIGFGPNNNEGPGFGEFYNDIFTFDGAIAHAENQLGGLALKPGSGEVVGVTMDPLDAPSFGYEPYVYAGGVRHMSNLNGQTNSGYVVYSILNAGTFGKATGLGDAVLTCNTPTFLQIGNYAWIDSDKDGVQSPCEQPLEGVKVALFKDVLGTLTFVAETTTNALGEYYFTGLGAPNENWVATDGTDSLLPDMDYVIAFGYDGTMSQFSNSLLAIGSQTFSLTTINTGEGTNPDQNDSDAGFATLNGYSLPQISLTTGAVGSVNHTYDIGFIPEKVALGNLVFMDTNDNGYFETGTDMGLDSVEVWLFHAGDDPATATPVLTTFTAGGGYYLFDQLDAGTYFVFIPGSAFATGAVLENKISALAEGGDTASDDNSDENGQNTLIAGGVRSTDIVLSANLEPTAEAGAGTYGGTLDDDNVNMTVDFAFKCDLVPDLSVTPAVVTQCGAINLDLATAFTVTDANSAPLQTGYPQYYSTAADAASDTNPLGSTTVTATGTYWVRHNAIGGCWDTLSMRVLTSPIPDVVARDTAICQGNSVDLSTLFSQDDLLGTISYYGSYADASAEMNALSAAQTPLATGDYFIRKETADGCFDLDSLTVTVVNLPDAGGDVVLDCPPSGGNAPSTYDFAQSGTWTVDSEPIGASANIDGSGMATGLTVPGVYVFRLTVTASGVNCFDTVQLTVPTCCKPVICLPIRIQRN